MSPVSEQGIFYTIYIQRRDILHNVCPKRRYFTQYMFREELFYIIYDQRGIFFTMCVQRGDILHHMCPKKGLLHNMCPKRGYFTPGVSKYGIIHGMHIPLWDTYLNNI
jgi:hypothetical protein